MLDVPVSVISVPFFTVTPLLPVDQLERKFIVSLAYTFLFTLVKLGFCSLFDDELSELELLELEVVFGLTVTVEVFVVPFILNFTVYFFFSVTSGALNVYVPSVDVPSNDA